eukprot:5234316-Pleurochrysis_carterae.AAC.7
MPLCVVCIARLSDLRYESISLLGLVIILGWRNRAQNSASRRRRASGRAGCAAWSRRKWRAPPRGRLTTAPRARGCSPRCHPCAWPARR